LNCIFPPRPTSERGLSQRRDIVGAEFELAIARTAGADGGEIPFVERKSFQILEAGHVRETTDHEDIRAFLQLSDRVDPRGQRLRISVEMCRRKDADLAIRGREHAHDHLASIEMASCGAVNRHRRLQPGERIRRSGGKR